jgi:hypothetical protein
LRRGCFARRDECGRAGSSRSQSSAGDAKGGWNGIGTDTITGSSIISGASLAITTGTGIYGININTSGAASLTGAVMIGNTMGDTVHQNGGGAVTIIPTCTLP